MPRTGRLVPACLVAAALVGCGGSGGPGSGPTDGAGAGTGGECGRIEVPGHVAVDVRTGGAGCETATALVEAAVGQGRQRYEADGFTCTPAEAGGGDTDYDCTRDGARITFRYGAA